jgi:hypothetical protein
MALQKELRLSPLPVVKVPPTLKRKNGSLPKLSVLPSVQISVFP